MNTLEFAIPPPIVALLIGLIMWLLAFLFPAFALPSMTGLAGAAFIGLAGIGIGGVAVIAFNRARTTPDPRKPAAASVLVTSGIYRLTRNPMYLGVLLLLISWGMFLGNGLALICAFTFVPYITRFQIQPEERILQQKFGAAFISYKTKVRRWL